jgi:recombination protein RecT
MNQRTTSLGAVANGEKPHNIITEFRGYLDRLKPQMALALPKHLNSDRMSRLVLTAFSSNPGLQNCSFQSIAGAIMTAAAQGLEPGVNGQGYLIPYGNTCTWVPGWKGLVDLVSRSGRASVWTGVVYKDNGDEFDYQLGDAPYVKHKPSEEPYPDGAKWTHVYAIGRVRDAVMPVIEVWSRAKVEKHLSTYNKVGNKHYAKKADTDNFEMYGRKVALLQVLKYMPSSIELQRAMDSEHAANEGRGMVLSGDDLVSVVDPDTGEVQQQEQQPAAAARGAQSPAGPTYAELADKLNKAANAEQGTQVLDLARHLPDDQRRELSVLFSARFES